MQQENDGPDDYALPSFDHLTPGVHGGRVVREGYQRGWGLQYGGLAEQVLRDPLYLRACRAAEGRLTHFSEMNRMNLFLILKFFLPRLSAGHIVEFGSFRGGSLIFMGTVCRALLPDTMLYGLDTFRGMPATDAQVDAHSAGDFSNTSLAEVQQAIDVTGLDNIRLVQGLFQDTAPALLAEIGPITLTHIDCDIKSGCTFAQRAVRPYLVPGAYIVFDDATISSCIGATEAVEELVRETGVHSEQIWPHFVFRHGL